MNQFFKVLVRDSFAGYVLYGDKPVCIEGYPLDLDSGAISGIGEKSFIIAKGFEIWKHLDIQPREGEYCILSLEAHGYQHLLFINKQAFLKVVNENLPLFRYVLGPTLTAEQLLVELMNSESQFYEVLKNDNVLLGILLGYGPNNALLVSREEYISEAFSEQRKEDFPFLAKLKRKELSNQHYETPSLGFSTLSEEIKALKTELQISRKLKPFDSCPIPYFGLKQDLPESLALLSTYEKNRTNILKAVESQEFLVETLSKFLGKGKLKVPSYFLNSNKLDKIQLSVSVGNLIKEDFKNEKIDGYLFDSFLEGLHLGFAGKQPQPLTFEKIMESYHLEKELTYGRSLETADAYFHQIAAKRNLNQMIPLKLYYKRVKKGKGGIASKKSKAFSFHYSYSLPNSGHADYGTVKHANLEELIPGIAQALSEMERGEIREVYIHPKLGYGEETYFPPNAVMIAKIELIDFHESALEAEFAEPHLLSKRDINDMQSKLRSLEKEEFVNHGINLWSFLKRGGIDFHALESALKTKTDTKTPNNPIDLYAPICLNP